MRPLLRLRCLWDDWRHPVSRLERLAARRLQVAATYQRVGLVFFMPRTRDRYRQQLWRHWQHLGRRHDLMLAAIHAAPALKAELYRRRDAALSRPATAPAVGADPVAPPSPVARSKSEVVPVNPRPVTAACGAPIPGRLRSRRGAE